MKKIKIEENKESEKAASWFATWFDSKYYHLLYQHRNDQEAQRFMRNLLDWLKPEKKDSILDLACGKGRHSIYLAGQGYQVTGVDLSPESIQEAKKSEHQRLKFRVHDMRQAIDFGPFDYIFNLFTSFGYFETEEEHQQTLNQMIAGLQPGGRLVMDFFNAEKVIQNLVLSEQKKVGEINFQLQRYVENGYIVKNIRFWAEGQQFNFQERVRALTLNDFKKLFEGAGLQWLTCFGDYDLNDFDLEKSDRLILLGKKEK